ncbi:hypothetical protein M1M21_gp70 [Flavobacterium phage vB_FspP_elemoC_14-1A]|uniref:Uncharacterized protein n=2 Tax=Elemovirus TaxID=2948694 RepID=A0A7D7FAY7_9CAUD|nr:hypothetical protein M1M19_gp73 [Flavobacterium phage vB_FspP_elemoB_14-3B]YP_010356478.1 hypothetical protein M1M21_gp70 [Flavobacterium phage vB_FspP_elemoC_14-1A]QMP84840.1 hypothetical protein elemo141A_phanotate40 [Flavobacterium phage vB_FspP_elemoC_14-1A]QMP84930.1 hypothetical protein elemo143B_phanotate40 [Flavobacterium phage vB_FspP_elemoB_14-3B]QMP85380.1 hypothetical protein elemo89C_phanotate41 [Flavobacterium phage vB_FspP_elemoA_8-9C]
MKVVKINTTAYEEEDFYLMTDLSEDDLYEVIMPIVNQERYGYEDYDNESLLLALKKRYPTNRVDIIEIEEISY